MFDDGCLLPTGWEGPPLKSPLDHVCLQPQEALDKASCLLQDSGMDRMAILREQVRSVVWLAFQFGVCQGYAMREQEHADDEPIRDALQHLKSKLEKIPDAEA